MADPKYANLPGIAYDQPDIYETSDLPEVDQASLDVNDESESVDRIALNVSDAYDKFKGKRLDASKTDFSDRISKHRRTGYNVGGGEYEMAEDGCEKETPQQKYQRLQHELRELMEEVTEIKETTKSGSTDQKQAAMILTKNVAGLQKQVSDIKLEQMLGSEIIANMADPQGILQKKLLTQVESFKKGSATSATQKPGKKEVPGTSEDQMVYELQYRPQKAQFMQASKTADLEQRLHKLEAILGAEPEKLSALMSDCNQKGLLAAVSVLTSKTNLLDSEHLDQVDARMQILSQKLAQIAEKKSLFDDIDKQNKVSEAYELLKKTESMQTTLPGIIDRMNSLTELHEQALHFSKALTQLSDTQQNILGSFQDNQKLMKELQDHFTKNFTAIQTNINNLDKRIAALKK